jgi:hypothetical protein
VIDRSSFSEVAESGGSTPWEKNGSAPLAEAAVETRLVIVIRPQHWPPHTLTCKTITGRTGGRFTTAVTCKIKVHSVCVGNHTKNSLSIEPHTNRNNATGFDQTQFLSRSFDVPSSPMSSKLPFPKSIPYKDRAHIYFF